MTTIIPTVFAHNKEEFKVRFERLIKISNYLQIDFMDGKLVPAVSVKLKDIPNLRKYSNNFEAHLMVMNPEMWFDKLKKLGFKKVLFHYESMSEDKIVRVVEKAKKRKLVVFLAINPETPVKKAEKFFDKIDGLLIMGVHPGKEGQSLDPNIFDRIKEAKQRGVKVQIDGGVNADNIEKIVRVGAEIINTGSFVSNADNPRDALKLLRKKSQA